MFVKTIYESQKKHNLDKDSCEICSRTFKGGEEIYVYDDPLGMHVDCFIEGLVKSKPKDIFIKRWKELLLSANEISSRKDLREKLTKLAPKKYKKDGKLDRDKLYNITDEALTIILRHTSVVLGSFKE